MNLSVKQTEHGLIVMVQKGKSRDRFCTGYEMEWVPAGQDELNEVCIRLSRFTDPMRCGEIG